MMMLQMMVHYLHTNFGKWMIQKMFQYSHIDTIEYGLEDEATNDDNPEDDSTFIY